MPSPERKSGSFYLRGVLAGGASPFRYRARVGALLGAADGHAGVKSSALVPPVTFQYPVQSEPFAPQPMTGGMPTVAAADRAGLPTSVAAGDLPGPAETTVSVPEMPSTLAAEIEMPPAVRPAAAAPTPITGVSLPAPGGNRSPALTRRDPGPSAKAPKPVDQELPIGPPAPAAGAVAPQSPSSTILAQLIPPPRPAPESEPDNRPDAPAQAPRDVEPSSPSLLSLPSRHPVTPKESGPVRLEAAAAAGGVERSLDIDRPMVSRTGATPAVSKGAPIVRPAPSISPRAPAAVEPAPGLLNERPDRPVTAGGTRRMPVPARPSTAPLARPAPQQNTVARLQAAVADLWSKASTAPAGRQEAGGTSDTAGPRNAAETSRPGKPPPTPETVVQPIYVSRPATGAAAPRAFWERSYLGSLRLRSLR